MSVRHFLSFLTVALGATCLSSTSRADGIPIDRTRTKITAPHTLFTMNEAQVEEATALRTFTLTPEQWAIMRNKAPGYPKRLTVVSHQHNDCTCGIPGYFAIWLPDQKIGVFNQAPHNFASAIERTVADSGRLSVTMDRRGQFYLEGQLIPYPSLKAQVALGIEKRTGKAESSSALWLGIGLPAGMTEESVTLAGRITEMREIFEEAGGGLWVH